VVQRLWLRPHGCRLSRHWLRSRLRVCGSCNSRSGPGPRLARASLEACAHSPQRGPTP
jgi:hypothetical protein